MKDTAQVNPEASIRTVPVAFRYPEDRIDLLDSIVKRRGDGDRSVTIRAAVDELIERYYPGATRSAAEAEAFAAAHEFDRSQRRDLQAQDDES